MSNYETKERSFTAFTNKFKKSDNHPDYRGTVKLDGVEYEIAIWQKQTRAGDMYFSGKIDDKPKVSREQVNKPLSQQAAAKGHSDDDSEIPF